MKRFSRTIITATELGMTMGLTAAGLVMLGLLLGRWLDSQLGTGPMVTLTLLVAGAVAGQLAMYRLALDSSRRLSTGTVQDACPFPEALRRVSLALRVLFVLVVPGLVGLAMGLWVDHMLRTRIVATLVLTLAGLAVGILGSLRLTHAVHSVPGERDDMACSEVERD